MAVLQKFTALNLKNPHKECWMQIGLWCVVAKDTILVTALEGSVIMPFVVLITKTKSKKNPLEWILKVKFRALKLLCGFGNTGI